VTAAVAYLRVSTDTQVEGFGLDIQRAAVAELAAAEGLELVAVHTDEGISGKEDVAGRAGLADALDALADGTATVLLVPRLDRLARDLMVQETVLADAWKHGARVLSCSETERVYCQPDTPDDPARTLIRQVLGAIAAYERAMIALRLRTGRRRRLAADGWAGGPKPYGWDDADERAVLERVTEARDDGATWRAITADLNAAGMVKRNGRPWSSSELHKAWSRARVRPAAHPARHEVSA
jgi:DNA invertase Pin-like site-specific DNA recombinase